MFLKFKIKTDSELGTEEWKVYECKNYSYRIFTLDKILDFLIYLKRSRYNNEPELVIPDWISEADLLIIPPIDNDLLAEPRIVSDKSVSLLRIKCVHFQITPLNIGEKANVITYKDVYVLGDKGQTVDRIIPNILKFK